MDFLAAGRFPEIGIIVSYSLVALFGYTGAWFVRRSKWLAVALLGIALIFTVCATSYFLIAAHAPAKWIEIEHYFVAVFGTVAAIALFPLFSIRFSREVEALRRYKKISVSANELSGFCSVLLRWESRNEMIIEDISAAMIQWFVGTGIATPSALKTGKNWAEALPHMDDWLDNNQETALGGKPFRNIETVAEINGKLIGWVWSMHLVDAAEKLIRIEWYNSTSFVKALNKMADDYESLGKVLEKKDAIIVDLESQNRELLESQLDIWLTEVEKK